MFRFDFDRLTYIYSKSLFIWIFETIVQKGLFYFFDIGTTTFCDMLALTGYKFVVLCPIAAAELVSYYGSYVVMLVVASLYGYFFFYTLSRYNNRNTLAAHMQDVSLNKKSFMLGQAAAQGALIWLLSYN